MIERIRSASLRERDELYQSQIKDDDRKTREHLYWHMWELERRECEGSYYEFFKRGWEELEPDNDLEDNWHIFLLCTILQREVERIVAKQNKKRDIIINVPPRSGKSYIVNIMLTPWIWTRYPNFKVINCSFESGLATKLCLDSRRLIQSDWYQGHWGQKFALTTDMNKKTEYENDKRGSRKSTSTGANILGSGADMIVVDDPQNPESAESEADRLKAKRYYSSTLYSRLNRKRIGLRVVIMQRLHEDDLTGYLLANDRDKYELICIPAEESDDIHPPELRRFYKDGLFFPSLFSREVVEDAKSPTNLGEYGYAGQMQQRPSPAEGGVFKRKWWTFWQPPGANLQPVTIKMSNGEIFTCETADLPARFDDVVTSWDTAFKDLATSDYVVGQTWGAAGPNKFLFDQDRAQLDFPSTVRQVEAHRKRNPLSTGILIEDKANGAAVIKEMRRVFPAIIEINPDKSKHARAMPMVRQCEAGNVYLPHPQIAPWVNAFIEEYANFPNGANDDQVDCGTQAINHLSGLKRIFPDFSIQKCGFKRQVDFKKLSVHSTLIVSQWANRDLETCINLALWNAQNMKLWVFGEFKASNAMPEVIVPAIKTMVRQYSGGHEKDLRRFMWYGNNLMFSRIQAGTMGIVTSSKDGMWEAYSRSGVTINDNPMFDEYGSILLINRLIKLKAIKIHTRCIETFRELSSWCIDGKQPADGYGHARAIINTASVLWETGRMAKQEKILKPYSKEKQKVMKEMDIADQHGMLDIWNQRGGSVGLGERKTGNPFGV